ncbi:MAG TPA: PEGA domain-containing protein, partial [Kofleriaceae bacterium]|nr:PEGA domain-containing protein [Kofleriaceae bacterium]
TPPPPLPPPPSPGRPSRPDWMSPAPATDPSAKPVKAAATARAGTKPPAKPAPRSRLVPAVIILGGLAAVAALYLHYRDRFGSHPTPGVAPVRDAGVAMIVDAGTGAGSVALGALDAGEVAPPTPIDAAVATQPAIDAAVAVAPGSCHLQISSTPRGAAITVNRRGAGSAPTELDVDCGPVTVTARLEDYQTATRQVTAEPGAPTVVAMKLARPVHNVTVVSTPRGAVVTLDGRRVGTTPLSVDVSGFSRHSLTISLDGYQTYRTSVQTDEKEQTVAVPLVKNP